MRPILPVLFISLLPVLSGCFPIAATGVGVGALMAGDRRTSGAYIEDESIENKTAYQIHKQFGDKVHVNITSFNRFVLLTGEAPDGETREKLEQLAAAMENVRGVTNEIVIAPPTSLSSRSNDTYLTSKVKGRMIDAAKFAPHLVKVVTENGVVYLMGIVSRQEASDAAEIARTTTGVKKVVMVFEYRT